LFPRVVNLKALVCKTLNSFFEIRDDDVLFRHVVFPVAFSSGKKTALRVSGLWRITATHEDSYVLETSVAWDRFVPTFRYVHEYGCRLANGRNQNKRRENGGVLREKERSVYCGAYQLTGASIRTLPSQVGEGVKEVDVIHKVEHGEVAHAALLIRISPDTLDQEGLKTAIMDRLWRANRGPLKHICEDDADLAGHPSEKLDRGPAGEAFSDPSGCLKLWNLFKFEVSKFALAASTHFELDSCRHQRLSSW
jgi:hypothetical protein